MNLTLNASQQDALTQILNFLDSDAQCLVLTGPAGGPGKDHKKKQGRP